MFKTSDSSRLLATLALRSSSDCRGLILLPRLGLAGSSLPVCAGCRAPPPPLLRPGRSRGSWWRGAASRRWPLSRLSGWPAGWLRLKLSQPASRSPLFLLSFRSFWSLFSSILQTLLSCLEGAENSRVFARSGCRAHLPPATSGMLPWVSRSTDPLTAPFSSPAAAWLFCFCPFLFLSGVSLHVPPPLDLSFSLSSSSSFSPCSFFHQLRGLFLLQPASGFHLVFPHCRLL